MGAALSVGRTGVLPDVGRRVGKERRNSLDDAISVGSAVLEDEIASGVGQARYREGAVEPVRPFAHDSCDGAAEVGGRWKDVKRLTGAIHFDKSRRYNAIEKSVP